MTNAYNKSEIPAVVAFEYRTGLTIMTMHNAIYVVR